MTVTTNGNGIREAAIEDARDGMGRAEIAAKYGMSDGWAGGIRREAGVARRGKEDAGPGPTVAPARVNGNSPTATVRKPAAKRKVADRSVIDWLIIGIVTAVAAIWSYSHIVDLAIAAGHGWRSYLLPLAIDGLLIAGVRAVGRDRRYPIAWIAIAVGVAGTVAGNVLAVRPELADMADVAAVSAAFPAIALPCIVHLVRR